MLSETGLTPPQVEVTRFNRLTAFVAKAKQASSRVICSVLCLEEIAALTRNREQREILDQRGHKHWPAYEHADAATAASDRLVIQATVLRVLEHAITALAKQAIVVEQPIVTDAQLEGKRIRKAHRLFLSRYQHIDSMDALHLAIGSMLSCKHFVTFDKAWLSIVQVCVVK